MCDALLLLSLIILYMVRVCTFIPTLIYLLRNVKIIEKPVLLYAFRWRERTSPKTVKTEKKRKKLSSYSLHIIYIYRTSLLCTVHTTYALNIRIKNNTLETKRWTENIVISQFYMIMWKLIYAHRWLVNNNSVQILYIDEFI